MHFTRDKKSKTTKTMNPLHAIEDTRRRSI